MKARDRGGSNGALRRAKSRRSKVQYVLVLYVAGSTPISMRAVQNLRKLCDKHLQGRHKVEVIDLYARPEMASAANVIAAPTMVKSSPPPLQRFVGDLSDMETLIARMRIRG